MKAEKWFASDVIYTASKHARCVHDIEDLVKMAVLTEVFSPLYYKSSMKNNNQKPKQNQNNLINLTHEKLQHNADFTGTTNPNTEKVRKNADFNGTPCTVFVFCVGPLKTASFLTFCHSSGPV